MKRFLLLVMLLSLNGLGINLVAQNRSGASQDQPPQSQQQPQAETQDQQSARAFEGRIARSGGKLVLQETSTQTLYHLDDQDKAKQFEGKRVKVMATMDPVMNTLHVIDITPAER
jgi:Protein of unknown function (DUF5818)